MSVPSMALYDVVIDKENVFLMLDEMALKHARDMMVALGFFSSSILEIYR